MALQWLTAPRYDDPLAGLRLPLVEEYVKPLVSHEILAIHIHELIASVLFYHGIYLLSTFLAPVLFAESIKAISKKTRIDTNVHVVSFIQSVLIMLLIPPLLGDPVLKNDRVFGYTPYAGLVATLALGYFIWDASISLVYVKMFGVPFLIHGVVSAVMYYIGLGPFILYYSAIFILFEASTPFLNLRWFGLKFPGLFPSWFRFANNAILILIFFFIRICYGWYQAFNLTVDFISNRSDPRFNLWGAVLIFLGNSTINALNIYWFYRMTKVAYAIIADILSGSSSREEAKKDI